MSRDDIFGDDPFGDDDSGDFDDPFADDLFSDFEAPDDDDDDIELEPGIDPSFFDDSDDIASEAPTYDFGDDAGLSDLDDLDDLSGFPDDFSEDFDTLDEEDDDGGGGGNRTFVLLAAIMIFLFLIGIGLIIFLVVSGEGGDQNAENTRVAFNTQAAAIETQNALDLATFEAEQTEQVLATQTAEAEQATAAVLQVTQNAIETETAEAALAATEAARQAALDATATQAVLDLTPEAPTLDLNARQTEQAEAANQTATAQAGAVDPGDGATPTPPPPATQADLGDVAGTATALANQLRTPIGVAVTPVEATAPSGGLEPGDGGQDGGIPGSGTGQLPETGSSEQNLLMIVLVGLGLIGVIFGARSLRVANEQRL